MTPAPTDTDIERLLKPIGADAKAGISLRYEGTYDKIREARREDDSSLPPGVWERPLKAADQSAVAALSADALEHRSKDLQIAAWLVEAWASLHGFLGAARGIALLAGLCDRFWDTMFPPLDDDNDEARARILDWVDDALARRLRAVRLGDERGPFTLADWERASAEPRPDDAGAPSREALLARISLVGSAHWAAMHDAVSAALDAGETLSQILGARMESPPGLRRAEGALRAVQSLAADVLKATGGRPAPAPAHAPTEAHRIEASPPIELRGGGAAPAPGSISSRADAYRWLTEAADYLLRTEPHSPVPYLVKRAIGWGNMSLAELLQEFIGSADDLISAHRLLGMRRRDE
jgi:type VI secretion system protein ImpA